MRVNISISTYDLKIIDEYAKKIGVTRSELLRDVTLAYIKNENQSEESGEEE